MKRKGTLLMGLALVVVVGFISLNITGPREALGCGGTEFAGGPTECPIAEFQMTMESEDWDPIARKMCFRTLKTEAGCTLYRYNIVPVTEHSEPGAEASEQYLDITYGEGCDVNRLEGSVIEVVDEERVEMFLSGTPTRAPIPIEESLEPLATGDCTSSKYVTGEFELYVVSVEE